ncbi:MAG: HAD-IB family phosphatase [Anaerolineae bacterium]|nr:HAD-IB family phosphatase [Thermoflexales bacterium]MDW8396127.1 HAD-IB family phosphatase [Anaerolineae bacterium]
MGEPRLVVSDLEGTLTTGETWRIVGEFLEQRGRGRAYRALVYRSLPLVLGARLGVLNRQRVREAWFERMTRLLEGFTWEQFEGLSAQIVEALWQARRVEVIAELEQHIRDGARLVIASGSYQTVADGFAKRLGGIGIGSRLEVDGSGHLTGALIGEVSTGALKAQRVLELANGAQLAVAYGDTEGDIPLLLQSEKAVAVHPDARLRRLAQQRGWRIIG